MRQKAGSCTNVFVNGLLQMLWKDHWELNSASVCYNVSLLICPYAVLISVAPFLLDIELKNKLKYYLSGQCI